MKDFLVECRNRVIGGVYTAALKPIFFKQDPEAMHDRMLKVGVFLGQYKVLQSITDALFDYSNPLLEQKILGMDFKNPVGLAAGFDKNAELTDILPNVGFGFAEVGSITGNRCEGNQKPRLWRLRNSNGLVVNYGLKSDGAEAVSKKLKNKHFGTRIGTSVAMTNCAENLDTKKAVLDYVKAFKAFADIGDYSTINISCPNAEGGQPFITPYKLDYLLDVIDEIPTKKPVFIKISPDLVPGQIDAILDVLRMHRVQGIICANLSKKRENDKIVDAMPSVGGISGKPIQEAADALLEYVYKKEKNRFVLVGCGGVFTAEDAYKKIRHGASLIQMVTGMIFKGPQVVSEINEGLSQLLARDGFKSVHDAIGVDVVAA